VPKVLGTFITEWDKGAEVCKEMLATEASAQMYAERLTELAAALGFDGWLVIPFIASCDATLYKRISKDMILWMKLVVCREGGNRIIL
jgi:endo-beta-N-acetylglucosaminidase D